MWGTNKVKTPKSNIDSERESFTPSISSDRYSTMMLQSPPTKKSSSNLNKAGAGKEKSFNVETEAKFINKNLTTLGRIF